MVEDEPFGTTAIPSSTRQIGRSANGGVQVTLDMWSGSTAEIAQQPQTQEFAVFEGPRNDECINGSLLDVNQHFVVYVVKKGLIRVLHRHSDLRTLLRGHLNQVVTDISFFLDGDVLATVGHSPETGQSHLIVWRVFQQASEIQSEKLLQVQSDSAQMSRLLWHPFNSNQLWVIHSIGPVSNGTTPPPGHQVATLVETTRIQTTMHPQESHPVCHSYSPSVVTDVEGAVQLSLPSGSLVDLAWSGRDTRHVLTVHSNGSIVLWDVKETTDTTDPYSGSTVAMPKQLAVIQESVSQSRCIFLPHENAVSLHGQVESLTTCFVTASDQNSEITIWSSFTTNPSVPPTKLQVLKLAQPSPSYVLDVCFGPAPQQASPPSCFLLWADRTKGQLYALHLASEWSDNNAQALFAGADYVVPFVVKYPVYSWCVVCAPTQDVAEDDAAQQSAGLIFDMKLFSYQSKAVQCLTLTSYMCLPPNNTFADIRDTTNLVYAEPLAPPTLSSMASAVTDETIYDEDYDVEEDDAEFADVDEAEDPADAAPTTIVEGNPADPFANWLGAIAGGDTSTPSSDMLPLPLPPPNPPSADAIPLPTPPPPGLLQTAPAGLPSTFGNEAGQSLLAQLNLGNAPEAPKPPKPAQEPVNNNKGKNKKKNRSKSPKVSGNPFPEGTKISILKREDGPPIPSSLPPPVEPPITNVPMPAVDPAMIDPAVASMLPPSAPVAVSNADIEESLTRIVAREFAKQPGVDEAIERAITSQLVPAVNNSLRESLASFGRPLQSSVDRLGQQGIRVDPKDLEALDLETPIKAAFADMIRGVFIPAMESITAQILQQATPLPPPPPPPPVPGPDRETKAILEALTKQLAVMNSKLDGVTQELNALKSARAPPSQPQPPAPAENRQSQLEAVRQEIDMLLQQNQYEAAFTRAVRSGMGVYACTKADLSTVVAGATPVLSQPTLLHLMHNLALALNATNQRDVVDLILEWLQEVALALNPAEPSIQQGVRPTATVVVDCINKKMKEGDPQTRQSLNLLLKVVKRLQR
eukprot:Nitzschia sp. Nitz4//scaffold89_size161592//68945//72049//NITZ4_002378-RA/size161592-processed-gene-0.44-mRNA-1//-1//CDS//3329559616//7602//frame0